MININIIYYYNNFHHNPPCHSPSSPTLCFWPAAPYLYEKWAVRDYPHRWKFIFKNIIPFFLGWFIFLFLLLIPFLNRWKKTNDGIVFTLRLRSVTPHPITHPPSSLLNFLQIVYKNHVPSEGFFVALTVWNKKRIKNIEDEGNIHSCVHLKIVHMKGDMKRVRLCNPHKSPLPITVS
jgi:hypothetical protein